MRAALDSTLAMRKAQACVRLSNGLAAGAGDALGYPVPPQPRHSAKRKGNELATKESTIRPKGDGLGFYLWTV